MDKRKIHSFGSLKNTKYDLFQVEDVQRVVLGKGKPLYGSYTSLSLPGSSSSVVHLSWDMVLELGLNTGLQINWTL